MNNASNILFVIEIYNKSAATKIHILSFQTIKVIKLTKYILILQIKYNVQSIKLNHSIFAFQLQNHKTPGQPIQQLMASFCYHMHMSRTISKIYSNKFKYQNQQNSQPLIFMSKFSIRVSIYNIHIKTIIFFKNKNVSQNDGLNIV